MTVLKLRPFLQICLVIKRQSGEEQNGQLFHNGSLFPRTPAVEVKDPLARGETRGNKEKQHPNAFPKRNQQ